MFKDFALMETKMYKIMLGFNKNNEIYLHYFKKISILLIFVEKICFRYDEKQNGK